jgi:hypothetical protein
MHEILPSPATDEQFAGCENRAEGRQLIARGANIPLGNSLLRVILLPSIRIRSGATSSQEEEESMIDPVREAVEAMLKTGGWRIGSLIWCVAVGIKNCLIMIFINVGRSR